MRCTTKCASNCRAGKVAVTLGVPRPAVLYCEPESGCEDALGYCNPDEYETLLDENIDGQLEAILEKSRKKARGSFLREALLRPFG